MTVILVLQELWRRWYFVAGAAILAGVVAVLAVYDVNFSPFGVAKRNQRVARGSIEILVDSSKSPIADVARNLDPLTARAGVLARFIAGGNVIGLIAKETGIPARQIEVASPTPRPSPVSQPEPVPASKQLPYGIEVVQREALPIVSINTRAPTVRDARRIAAAAPAAVRQIVEEIQQQQGIPTNKRVIFRKLGPAQGGIQNNALGARAAIGIFTILFALQILLILAVPRLRAAWWWASWQPDEQDVYAPNVVTQLPTDTTARTDDGRALTPASDSLSNEAAKRI